mgnify:CR=1 FL=1
MLTKQDKKFLAQTFATKDDLAPIKKDISLIRKDTSSIHKEIKKLRKAEEVSAKYFDTVTTGHRVRLKNIEKHLDLPTPPN